MNPGTISINGQREFSNAFIVNGSDVEEDVSSGAAIIPNLDSIAEFRILTSNFDAEYGGHSGGQINVVTKSGTNQLHGDAFEFLRNTSLDARNYFSPTRGTFDQNQFGGTLGGPIRKQQGVLLHRLSGNTIARRESTPASSSVPSLQERSGIFPNFVIPPSDMVRARQESSAIHSPAQRWPTTSSPPRPRTRLCATTRLPSASITKARWGRLDAYYFFDDYTYNNPYPTAQSGASVPGFNALYFGRAQLLSLGDTKTLGSTAVNEFHFSYMRDSNDLGKPIGGLGVSLASQGFVVCHGTTRELPRHRAARSPRPGSGEHHLQFLLHRHQRERTEAGQQHLPGGSITSPKWWASTPSSSGWSFTTTRSTPTPLRNSTEALSSRGARPDRRAPTLPISCWDCRASTTRASCSRSTLAANTGACMRRIAGACVRI